MPTAGLSCLCNGAMVWPLATTHPACKLMVCICMDRPVGITEMIRRQVYRKQFGGVAVVCGGAKDGRQLLQPLLTTQICWIFDIPLALVAVQMQQDDAELFVV